MNILQKFLRWNNKEVRKYLAAILAIFVLILGPLAPRGFTAENSFDLKYAPKFETAKEHKAVIIEGAFPSGFTGSCDIELENCAMTTGDMTLKVIKGEIRFKSERLYGGCHKIITRCLIKCAVLSGNGKPLTFHCRYLKTWCNTPAIPE